LAFYPPLNLLENVRAVLWIRKFGVFLSGFRSGFMLNFGSGFGLFRKKFFLTADHLNFAKKLILTNLYIFTALYLLVENKLTWV
jgi:hypothetical protein